MTMDDFDAKEKRFEQDIEEYLITKGGYTKGDPSKFNRQSGLDEGTFVEFIKTSQPKLWDRYKGTFQADLLYQVMQRQAAVFSPSPTDELR